MNLKPFEPIVSSLSKKFKIRNTDPEDVRQDLYVKLIELLPRLESLPEIEAKKLCRFALSKHAIDLYNKEKKHKIAESANPRSVNFMDNTVSERVDIVNTINVAVDCILVNYKCSEITEEVESNQLRNMIKKWAKEQASDICHLVTELIDPSPATKLAYISIAKGNKKETDVDFISPWKLARALNMSERTWFKARTKLRKYLCEIGYEPMSI